MQVRTVHASNWTLRRFPRPPRAVLLMAGLVGVLVLAGTFGTSALEVYRLEREAAELSRTKGQLQEQNALLHEEIRLLYTPAYIEKLAREQLGLIKSGEIAVFVVQSPAPPRAQPSPPPEHVSWTKRVWDAIGRLFAPPPAPFH